MQVSLVNKLLVSIQGFSGVSVITSEVRGSSATVDTWYLYEKKTVNVLPKVVGSLRYPVCTHRKCW